MAYLEKNMQYAAAGKSQSESCALPFGGEEWDSRKKGHYW